ncbi:hypothetical protein KAB87_004100 [Salmonella enterica]|nr:hypothetical protein [Salmonella enterica]
MSALINEVFGRINESGNVDVLYSETGELVTRLDVDGVYPVGSEFSTRYDHPDGIVISVEDAKRIGLDIE